MVDSWGVCRVGDAGHPSNDHSKREFPRERWVNRRAFILEVLARSQSWRISNASAERQRPVHYFGVNGGTEIRSS